MKFLIVDDSPTMRRIVINALRIYGPHEFVEAEDGVQALTILHTEKVDFVITDWNMPNLSGIELTRAIRSDEQLGALPIIMVTTRGLKQDIVEALQAKVNHYIVKPFTPQILKEKINAVLKAMGKVPLAES